MKVYEVVAKTLADLSNGPLFGLCGDGNLFMVNSFVSDCGRRFVKATHEANAVLMALGYAQISGEIGVATVTHGPGLTNCMTALVEGLKAHTPMVLIAADTAVQDRDHLQKVDQAACVLATGAGFEQMRAPATIAEDVGRAFHRASCEKRPVVVNMPIEYQWEDAEYRKSNFKLLVSHYATVDGENMDKAIGIIASAHSPVILAGRGAIGDADRAAISKFAKRIGAPVATTLRGKDLFFGDPFNLGFYGTLSTPVASEVIARSDCIIAIGASLNRHTADFGHLIKKKRIIQIGMENRDIGNTYPVDVALIGKPNLVVNAMIGWLDQAEIPDSGCRTEDLRRALHDYRSPERVSKKSSPGTVDFIESLRAIDVAIPRERILVTDTGRYIVTVWKEIGLQTPRNLIHTTNFAAIGSSLGEAIGAAMARPNQTTLLVIGDGGLMLTGFGELSTAVREHLNLVIVVCNDGSYGAEHVQYQERNIKSDIATFDWPDFDPIARAFGVPSVNVRSSDDLASAMLALERRDTRIPFLIDLHLDRELIPNLPH